MPTATAAVLSANHEPFVLEKVEIDSPIRGEVLVRIVATGLCHTDLSVREGLIPFPLPGVLGHEGPLAHAHQLEALGYLHMAIQEGLGTGYGSAIKVVG